jgi:hypothetical protein
MPPSPAPRYWLVTPTTASPIGEDFWPSLNLSKIGARLRRVNDAELWLLATALGAGMAALFHAASRRRPRRPPSSRWPVTVKTGARYRPIVIVPKPNGRVQ